MRHSYHAEQWLPYPVQQVFAFFANPGNLPRLMPEWQKARIEEATIAPPPPRPATVPSSQPASKPGVAWPAAAIAAGAGTRIILSFRPFPFSPIRLPWEAEITEFVWNERFCDLQRRGPFAYWNHCHSVRAASESGAAGTTITDQVEYELPLGVLGELAHTVGVRSQIERIFAFRHARTAELLAAVTAQSR